MFGKRDRKVVVRKKNQLYFLIMNFMAQKRKEATTMRRFILILLFTITYVIFSGNTVVQSSEVKLPKTISWTAFDMGSTNYNQAVAIGKALQDAYGTKLRVVPAQNDLSRLSPVREGRIQVSGSGSGVFMAVEGVLDFAVPDWGPQAVQLLMSARGNNGLTLATAADANIKTPYDLKGKRCAWLLGSSSLQTNVTAIMAFGNLTWADVQKVEISGYGGLWRAFFNNQVDAVPTFTTGPSAKQAASSPRGLHWLPLPASDKEGWKRLKRIAPHFMPQTATLGAGISKEKPLECASFPSPNLVTYEGQDASLVYNLVKAISLQVDNFSKSLPVAKGWASERQTFQWVVPYHKGAVKYWREIGLWTEEAQAHNDRLLKRCKVLADAWKKMKNVKEKGNDFRKKWMQLRAEALGKAGFDPYWR